VFLNGIGDASPYLKTAPHITLTPTCRESLSRARYLPQDELSAVPWLPAPRHRCCPAQADPTTPLAGRSLETVLIRVGAG